MTLEPWLRRHPLIGYFALAYGISWGGILILLVARGLDLAALQPLDTSLMVVLMLPGLSTGGLALTARLEGGAAATAGESDALAVGGCAGTRSGC